MNFCSEINSLIFSGLYDQSVYGGSAAHLGPEFPPRMGVTAAGYPGGAAAQAVATAAGLDQAAAAAQYMAGHHGYDVYKGKSIHCLSSNIIKAKSCKNPKTGSFKTYIITMAS